MSSCTHTVDWNLIFTLGIPAAIVIAGWFLVHWLSARRDLASRRREARIKSLETAFLRLATSANRPLTDALMDEIELFVSELQLYGTPSQIAAMQEIVEGLKKPNNPVSFDTILTDIRDTIRSELDLEPVSGGVWWLRMNRVPPNATPERNGGQRE